ncbi:MFS general substrate transporter [Xylona heveae TC161]|uniref:MFS general substrate transporter n=1 Tax=Xylona heveae (strain CBS 132557 / TC161) TaxID=1328760 RepID=A0A165IGG7_XYLHT|nr:MFS general substrate transporter [Xylona heveae TC161]KZF24860.1 MFS general substrate transporter [Xylona heveae TC161]
MVTHPWRSPSQEELLPSGSAGIAMHEYAEDSQVAKDRSRIEEQPSDGVEAGASHATINDYGEGTSSGQVTDSSDTPLMPAYRVYRRRWFGLAQLVLLNIIVSWNWLTFSPVSTTSAQFFGVSESAINWLSTAFLFAFCVVSPVVIWTLNKGGPKPAIVTSSIFVLAGNWIRYGGTRASPPRFGVVMFGQVLIGLAQPFVLAAPTRYSDLWFTDRGRISATAIASLANPFGGALGQLVDPFLATKPSDMPNMVLIVAIIASVASLPSFVIPGRPPTPPSASAAQTKMPLRQAIRTVVKAIDFWLLFIPFSIYVGLFNSISSLLNQILSPYGFSETEAGICGALLIIVGLVASAVTSPLIDKYKFFLAAIKLLVPIIAICYLVFIFAPPTRTVAAPYVIASILGASCFSLVPVALEWLVEISHPVSPEFSSTVCWTGGQLLGACFILIEDALRDGSTPQTPGKGREWWPQGNLQRALIFQAVIAAVGVPLALCIGLWGEENSGGFWGMFKGKSVGKRLAVDLHRDSTSGIVRRSSASEEEQVNV